MTQYRFPIKPALLFLYMLCAVIPCHASELCSSGGKKRLDALDPAKIVSQIVETSHLSATNIKEVQSCLGIRGCYSNDPRDVDGVVGPYTTAALYRFVYGRCPTTPPPPPDCGDGQEAISYSLTNSDIQELEKPPQQEPAPKETDADAPAADKSDAAAQSEVNDTEPDTSEPAMSQHLMAGLSSMQNADFPTRGLFENALAFFTTQPLNNTKDYATVAKELDENKPSILKQACKIHTLSSAGAGWAPDWKANMLYSLSDPVYGFFPFWTSGSPPPSGGPQNGSPSTTPHKVDFGTLERIGWVGVTFSQDGKLNLTLLTLDNEEISEQIEVAHRFRTSVDLVIYKQFSRAQWIDLVYSGSDTFMQTLSSSIANTVGAPLKGFLNGIQYWVLPGLLTSPTTAWDGATIDFQDYPYDDPVAMQFLVKLLTQVRQKLTIKERRMTVWSPKRHLLHLNLIVPFDVFVPPAMVSASGQFSDANEGDSAVIGLAQLVPQQGGDESASSAGPAEHDSIVDSFIVFLPQSTSMTKKQLRQAVEDAFNRDADILQLVKNNSSLSLAAWRFQMLRRITCVLSPYAWQYKGVYSQPGIQFYDDMLYAHDNFGAAGFWPLPSYDGNNQELAAQTRQIFRLRSGDAIQKMVAPVFEKMLGLRVANFFGGWRRELFLNVEFIFAVLAIYLFCAYWLFELRDFYRKHKLWFALLGLEAISVLVLLCLFDHRLREWALLIFIGLVFAAVVVLFALQYFISRVERDLP
ncbi:MAG: hypothetical protein ABSE51_16795 [Terracidiphilus sp.]